MADHGTVEYATATGSDVAADLRVHQATYRNFVQLAFIATLHVVNVLLGLATGAVAGHWGLAFTIFVLATVLAFHGLASGARTPMLVMTAISLLALGLAA